MSKQYGLIVPGQQKKATAATREPQRSSVFDEDSSTDSESGAPQLKPKRSALGPSAMERRIARQVQAKALEEDPTVFQYDELYDEMENKREEEKQTKAAEPKKPKYITKLLETAERRKLENELRVERQVQKEREAEGEEFKDKESFVTSTYRKKLEEMRKLEEQEKRAEYLEAIGDVTKQNDLDGFYRHLYEQKLGPSKDKPIRTAAGDEEVGYKPIKSEKPTQQRAYRKRRNDDDDDEATETTETGTEVKKVHLQNNIDADSDFSIDSSSSDEEDTNKIDNKEMKKPNISENKVNEVKQELKSDEPKDLIEKVEIKTENLDDKAADEKSPVRTPPKPKIDVWKKRTVGDVFDAAVQRYYERKAARNA